MDNDWMVCRDGEPCRRQQFGPQPGSESAAIVQRLDELMRRCREQGHRLVYQDLLEVRGGPRMHGVSDDDGNLLIGQRGDGSPIWNDPENPVPLRRVAHFSEEEARRKAWELAAAGYGPTGISKLHHT